MPTTTFMGLNLPTVSTTIGPDWATDLNAALTLVDSHDHTSSKGQQIPTAGLNINATLDFNDNSLDNINDLIITSKGTDASNNNSIYVKSGELYFKDNSGNAVQITSGGTLDIAGTGGIGGDYTTTAANAYYNDSTKTYFFLDSTSSPADMDVDDIILNGGAKWDTGSFIGTLSWTPTATRTLTLPDTTDTLVGKATTDILTNKSIDSDNNTITNIVNADIKATAAIAYSKLNLTGNILNADINASAAIDASKIADGSVSSTEFQYLNGVTSAIQTQIDNKVGLGGNETIAGDKTFSGNTSFDNATTHTQVSTPSNPSSGDNKLYFKSDDKLYKLDSAGNELEVGSGTGSGEINYIDNSDFESNTSGWSTYADAAGSTPVDGTGGSATVTIASQATTILRGSKSLKITKDAADRQGEGFSYDFTIKEQDVSKKLKIQFDFKTNEDAAYASGDLAVYIYDVDNSTLITPVDTDIIDGAGIFQTSFNSTTSTNYRLIFHIATTNASAWDVYIDNVIVGPGMTSQGAAIGPWTDYTPAGLTGGEWGSSTSITFQYRRVGDSMEIKGEWTAGTTLSAEAQIDLPSGFTIASDTTGPDIVGQAGLNSNTNQIFYTIATSGDAFLNMSRVIPAASTNVLTAINADSFLASGQKGAINAKVQIAEWAGKGIVPMLAEDNLQGWTTFTGSGSWTTNTTYTTAAYKRVGNEGVFYYKVDLTGAPNSANLTLDMPSNLTVDTDEIIGSQAGTTPIEGRGVAQDNTGSGYHLTAHFNDTSSIRVRAFGADVTESTLRTINQTTPFTWASGDSLEIIFRVPVVEFAGSQNSLVGYSQADGTNTGLLPPVTSMSDALATQLGFKEYTDSDVTISVVPGGGNPTGITVHDASFFPYQTQGGVWRMRCNINVTLSGSGSFTAIDIIRLSGVTFTANEQPLYHYSAVVGTTPTQIRTKVSAGDLTMVAGAGRNCNTEWSISGDVELTAKPTWAI